MSDYSSCSSGSFSSFDELAYQYIGGEWRAGSGSWDIVDFNPYDGEKLASITVATVEEIDLAYRAAERAQPAWGATNPYRRRLVFERALRVIDDHEDELAAAITAECGGTAVKAAFELH
ncbi:aldehyde dehydrogenase family protein, partial [Streptomyces sp. NPDC057654]|uniref:aldehyde dehydrogenase family protein n=1 Tax=Streptomyces sp. NPDC057654 TaxID=3346196 RepID=UPI0036C39F16